MNKGRILLLVFIIILLFPFKIDAQITSPGKTFCVFIANSEYKNLNKLDGPELDAMLIKFALSSYQIDSFIYKKNLSKAQMEHLFSIEIKNLIKTKNVKSLLIWYAGSGGSIEKETYWLPVDATNNDVNTYYSTNDFISELKDYKSILHYLVINDASWAGSGLSSETQAISRLPKDPQTAMLSRSAQFFSSCGYEEASDNSQFSRTFANVLVNNSSPFISIESIAEKVMDAVLNSSNQKPIFGTISKLPDENGTFILIRK